MSLKDRLKHREGGNACDWYYSKEHKQVVADCRNCGDIIFKSMGGDDEADEHFKLTFVLSTDERQYRRNYVGFFCDRDCLIEFLETEETE